MSPRRLVACALIVGGATTEVARHAAATRTTLLSGEAWQLALPAVPWLALTVLGLLGLLRRRGPRWPDGASWIAAGAALVMVLGTVDTRSWLLPWQVAIVTVAALVALAWSTERLPWLTAAVGAVAILFWAASPPDAPRAALPQDRPTPSGPSVVLVTLDTVRADHLGTIGGFRSEAHTPHLDALADAGLLWTEGVAPVPLTLPSHTAMLTGLLPEQTRVTRNGQVVPDDLQTVAERLAAEGWATGAFLSSHVLARRGGLHRGFDHYDDVFSLRERLASTRVVEILHATGLDLVDAPGQRDGRDTLRRALAWRAAQDRPSFLWLHLYDAHAPYRPPRPFDALYDPEAPDAPGAPPAPAEERKGLLFDPMSLTRRDLRVPVARYAAEVSYVDSLVGDLLDALPGDVPLLVAADHGESLVEHDYRLNHGSRVYQPSVRIPILLRAPGLTPRRIDTPTPLHAVGPTLLRLAGLEAEDDLLSRLDAPTDDPVLSHAPRQQSRIMIDPGPSWRVAFREGPDKWIVDDEGTVEHYRLDEDPGESHDLADPDDPRVEAWRARGLARIEHLSGVGEEAPDAAELLEALGYVE